MPKWVAGGLGSGQPIAYHGFWPHDAVKLFFGHSAQCKCRLLEGKALCGGNDTFIGTTAPVSAEMKAQAAALDLTPGRSVWAVIKALSVAA